MGLFDGFEKLINEHGSATILKERIELVKEKYSDLERKYQLSVETNETLEREKQVFELENFRLKEKVSKLEKTISDLQSADLNDKEVEILKFLATRESSFAKNIALELGIDREAVNFYLEELEKKEMVYGNYAPMVDTSYSLIQEGRRYLINTGVIK